jgi:hypothetical protein
MRLLSMSSRDQLGTLVCAKNNPYRNILDLIQDKERIDLLADAAEIAKRNVRKDECNQWTIIGKRGQVQTFDEQSYLLYVSSYSSRKWSALKRKAKSLGWEITQDGDDEGCFRLGLPDESQAIFLREILGLRKRRGLGRRRSLITRTVQHLKNGGSVDFVSVPGGQATQVTAQA